ncbi:MAG: UDP-N-acetylmuramate:L-alanyl-gamma-D-glutamyl-meso-diaminopimelate ligase [Verrucomicrobia bacterium]|nr:MAG: UDP-N-acetylmuramate:L-alanyl-gamma-D-glutamyl-meso-diaminopimelate ligase [Verrucomicrobiota bacterium]PYK94154.1 MAG: UDP-N-acetylmuramate:L-alanyl-gamma-D-glutamyl-meso-diaminopimelate ligase [Verrucomicrobiota bacterium]PYL56013.1 MAG: UDP-N-acetylmuramate:L-alanyl-gamma-D-glutamyl-meso-diaminopimelate ligase [Verrucomicrobiota bacterium]
MTKEPPRHFHFLGICGTAMGSVAAELRERGFSVTGSDENIYPPMSIFLEKKGIALKEGYRAENIPADVDIVVVGNVIKRGNPEVEAVLNRKLFYLSLPEVLKNYFLRGHHNLVVTGTHGKTTTTALLAWIMEKAGHKPGYLVGGLSKNLAQGARLNRSEYFVIEGDEYDSAFFDKRSKFIHYLPELVIVNNIEFDHADIFHDLEEVKLSFRRLLNVVPQNGMVLLNGDDRNCVEVAKDCLAQMVEVGFSENCAQRIREMAYSSSGSRFKLGDDKFEISLIGEFNVRNAAMAVTAARFYDVPKAKIDNALKSFSGIARRQEVRGEVRGVKVVDDFGHHPTAIAQTIQALRHRYPGHRIWAVFEPRSNTTRRAVFQKQLPDALQLADGVFIAQVAKLEQIPEKERLNPESVVAAIANSGRPAFYEENADAIVDRIVPMLQPKDVVVVFSNGGFDNIHEKLLKKLQG